MLLRINKCKWEKIAVLADNDKDLRDPYLLVKDNKLIIYCGYNKIKDNTYAHAVQRIAFFKRVVIILL